MNAYEQNEAISSLRKFLPRGTIVYLVLRSVGDDGMIRYLDLYCVDRGDIVCLTWDVAKALDRTYDREKEALCVEGCGMDMGFYIVHGLAHVLHGDGRALRHRWI